MSRLPNGESDFKKIRSEHFAYIDKTRYIELIERDSRFLQLMRPRRFGKSLFVSMLSYYYDIYAKEEFNSLFQGTYIYEHPTARKNRYLMLNFDFFGLRTDTLSSFKVDFRECIIDTLSYFLSKYKVVMSLEKKLDTERMLSSFFHHLKDHVKYPIYVTIDEADHLMNDIFLSNYKEKKKIQSIKDYVRKFYEALKMGTGNGVIDRIFITGVSPITLDSMTSGFNISMNLSLDSRYNEIMGFTNEETEKLIYMVNGVENENDTLKEMKQYYDGYLFSKDGSQHMFHPNMVLYYLDNIQKNGCAPSDIIDKNIFSDYKNLENLIYLSKRQDQSEQVQRLLDGEQPDVILTEVFQMDSHFTADDFYSLLFYLGYLTIAEGDEFGQAMKIPNLAIQKIFISYFRNSRKRQWIQKKSISIKLQDKS